jgi:hypothetical protein
VLMRVVHVITLGSIPISIIYCINITIRSSLIALRKPCTRIQNVYLSCNTSNFFTWWNIIKVVKWNSPLKNKTIRQL